MASATETENEELFSAILQQTRNSSVKSEVEHFLKNLIPPGTSNQVKSERFMVILPCLVTGG